MSARPHVRLSLLGAFSCTRDGAQVNITGRLRSMLAVLALSAGEPVSVDRLTASVWGEDPPAEPRRALQVYVNRLRERLGAAAISTHPAGYQLDVGADDVDVLQFGRLVAEADDAADPEQQLALIEAALDLFHGDPFESVSAPPLEEVDGPRLAEQCLRLRERRFDLLMESQGDREATESLVAEMDELTRRHPLREPLWERLLTALVAADRGAEALGRYEEVRTLLAEELGTDPGRGLQTLYARLLEGAAVVQAPRQLLPDPPRFIGRERALATMDDVLLDDLADGAAVALTGIGGAGKTALATRWAHHNQESFADGQLYVDLHGYSSQSPLEPSAALEVLLRGLGVASELLPQGLSERSALLRSTLTGRRTLLILDNARDADHVRALLPGGSARTIITSRNQLRGLIARDGAHPLALEPLDATDATSLLSSIVGTQRVVEESEAAYEIVELCGRLPLAVAITAERVARFTALPLADAVQDLSDATQRLRHLAVGGDERSDLRAVFELSYERLDQQSARVFRLLSLLPDGTFDGAAVGALTDVDPVRAATILDGLAADHLVQQSGPRTYWLHDLLRVYADEQCRKHDGEGAADAAVARAGDWLLGRLNAACLRVRPDQPATPLPIASRPAGSDEAADSVTFAGSGAAIDWFRREQAVLIGWIHRMTERGLPDHVWRLAAPLSLLMEITEHRTGAASLAALATEAAHQVGDPAAVYVAEDCAGRAYARVRRLDEADAALETGLNAAREVNHRQAEAAILCSQGTVRRLAGELDESLRLLQQALDLSGEPDGSLLEASESAIRTNIAGCYYLLHSFDEAVDATRAALQCARAAGDQVRQATCLNNLTVMLELTCDYAGAEEAFSEAERLSEQIGVPAAVFDAYTARGRMLVVAGDRAGAERMWEWTLAQLPPTDNPRRLEVLRLLERVRGGARASGSRPTM